MTIHALAWILLGLWFTLGIVSVAEGLKPRGSASYRTINFAAELALLTLAIWTLLS